MLQPWRADGGVGQRRRDGATLAGCVRYCRPLTSTLMWAQRIAREDLGCKAAAPPPLSTTCGAVRSGESGACAWLAGTDPSQLATAGPDASTGARPSSALIERDSERSPSSAAGAVCRPPMPLAAGPRRSPRRSRRSHRRRRWISARVCFAAAVCARGAAPARSAPPACAPRQQKMQNPTGTACAAAPRFLQTLARAGSLRAASGRCLKTLGQNFSS